MFSKFVMTFSILLPVKAFGYLCWVLLGVYIIFITEKHTAGFLYDDALIMVSKRGECYYLLYKIQYNLRNEGYYAFSRTHLVLKAG